MSENLKTLLEKTRNTKMTREQQEEQRRSFAYGNSNIENDRITRETIARSPIDRQDVAGDQRPGA